VSERGEPIACPRCGREERDPSINFCPNCGAPLRGEPARQKLRRRLAGLFVFLTVLSLVVTVVGAWARAVALDTDRFVATVGPVIDEPAVQQALSVRLTDRVMEGLQVEDRVATALSGLDTGDLPVSPALLAAPITEGIRTALLKRTEQALASDAVRALWYDVLARAHEQAIALLRGESTNATIEGDAVYINLLPFINDALASLEQQLSEIFNRTIDVPRITADNVTQGVGLLEQQFGVDLPDDFGQIKVFESDALPAAQAAVAAMDRLIYALVALTLVLAIVALVLSPRRLRTVLWLGLGAALGLIVVRRLALRLDDAIVERVSGETNQAAVGAVTSDVFQDLRNFTTLMLIAAIVVGIGAYVAGRPPWLTRTLERASDGTLVPRDTGAVRWIGEHATALQVVTVTLGAMVLLFASLGWTALLIVLVLVAAAWFALTYLRERATANGSAPG
jgi:ABC-type multidrug transport system fused ATPase/permease subunit